MIASFNEVNLFPLLILAFYTPMDGAILEALDFIWRSCLMFLKEFCCHSEAVIDVQEKNFMRLISDIEGTG